MATLKIYDRADEFRIEIAGRFAGDCVPEAEMSWRNALLETAPRTVVVDISRLSGFDNAGRKLLQDMHKHGTQFAAKTPQSLVFLSEISQRVRRGPAPTLVHSAPSERQKPQKPHVSAIASGQ